MQSGHNNERTYNGYTSIKTGQCSKGIRWPVLITHVFLHHMGSQVHVHCLHGEEMAPGRSMVNRKDDGACVILCAGFCRETLGPGIHVDVAFTCTTYLNITAGQVRQFMVIP